jgi:hypothetical protein
VRNCGGACCKSALAMSSLSQNRHNINAECMHNLRLNCVARLLWEFSAAVSMHSGPFDRRAFDRHLTKIAAVLKKLSNYCLCLDIWLRVLTIAVGGRMMEKPIKSVDNKRFAGLCHKNLSLTASLRID